MLPEDTESVAVPSRTTSDVSGDGIDDFEGVPRLMAFGLQHVLVMYAGTVAVPLILGSARPRDRPEEELAGYRRALQWAFS